MNFVTTRSVLLNIDKLGRKFLTSATDRLCNSRRYTYVDRTIFEDVFSVYGLHVSQLDHDDFLEFELNSQPQRKRRRILDNILG